MKKVLSLITTICLVASLAAGCGSTQPAGTTTAANETTTATTAAATAATTAATIATTETPKAPEPITLTLWSDKLNPGYDNYASPVAQKLKEKTGITLDVQFANGDVNTAIGLLLASGEIPDMVQITSPNLAMFVKAKAIQPWDKYLDQYGPNIKAAYGDVLSRTKYSAEEKVTYALTGQLGMDTQPGRMWNTAFQLQAAALKEMNYPKINTLEDYSNVLKSYVKAHPTTDGKPTIGLSLICSDGWRWFISLTNPAFYSTGAKDDGNFTVDPQTFTAQYHYRRPEERAYFKWLNGLYNDKLLDPESFTQNYDTYLSKISTGRVVGLIDGMWEFMGGEGKLRESKLDDKTYVPFPVVADPKFDFQTNASVKNGQTTNNIGLCMSSTTKYADRITQFVDYIMSEEGQILVNWGIEGKDYDVKDGVRTRKADLITRDLTDHNTFAKETGINTYDCFGFFPGYGNGMKDSTGNYFRYYDKQVELDSQTQPQKDALKAYGADLPSDLFKPASAYPITPWGNASDITITNSDITAISQAVNELTFQGVVAAIVAKPDGFDKMYDKLLADIDAAGGKKVEDEMTRLIAARMELWK